VDLARHAGPIACASSVRVNDSELVRDFLWSEAAIGLQYNTSASFSGPGRAFIWECFEVCVTDCQSGKTLKRQDSNNNKQDNLTAAGTTAKCLGFCALLWHRRLIVLAQLFMVLSLFAPIRLIIIIGVLTSPFLKHFSSK